MIKANDMRAITLAKNTEINELLRQYEKDIRKAAEDGKLCLTRTDEKTSYCPLIGEYLNKFGYKVKWQTGLDRGQQYSDITISW